MHKVLTKFRHFSASLLPWGLLLFGLLVLGGLGTLAPVETTPSYAQESPLASPLAEAGAGRAAAQPTDERTPQSGLMRIAAILTGMVVVVGWIVWRQR